MAGEYSNSESGAKSLYSLDPFFESSADLLIIAGFDGYFKRINPAVVKLLGYSMNELLTTPIDDFIHPEDREITIGYRENIKKNVPLLYFENRYITKSGKVVWLSWTSIPIESERLVYAIAKNITHKKKVEQDRAALIANLTKANKDLKELTYSTSHDLRSPVNNLLSVHKLLEAVNIQDGPALELISILRAATENLNVTLNNYLNALGRKGSLNIGIEKLALSEVLRDVQQSIDSLIKDSKVRFTVDFSLAENVTFNRAYLESIFLNLITNSIKYARPGVTPVISIHSSVIDDRVKLVLSDNGLGFDMDKVKDKIFGLRQSFHNHADSKGIGLYLVYTHIASLGGTIDVASKINEGTTFTISFAPEP